MSSPLGDLMEMNLREVFGQRETKAFTVENIEWVT
jgi:hypothetical protein